MLPLDPDPAPQDEYIHALIQRLYDEQPYHTEWWDVVRRLGNAGAAAVEPLIPLLDPRNPGQVVRAAAMCLRDI